MDKETTMGQALQVSVLPNRGYIIEMPYDEAVGSQVFVSIIPYSQNDKDFIEKHKSRICVVKTRIPDEDDFAFKMRLEEIINRLRRWNRTP